MKNTSIDKFLEVTNKFLSALIDLDKRINNTNSATLKELLQQNYNVGAQMYARFCNIINLYQEYFEISEKYSSQVLEKASYIGNTILAEMQEILENIEKTECDDTKDFQRTILNYKSILVEKTSKNAQNYCKFLKFEDELTFNMIYLSFLNSYLPFTLNDYNKYKIIKEQILDIIKTIIGLNNTASTIITLLETTNNIASILLSYDNDYLKESFFTNLDDDMVKIEMQKEKLIEAYNQQTLVIDYLEVRRSMYEQKLQQ